MDTAETCRERAAAQRALAEQSDLPRERAIYLQSAKRWEEMADIAEGVELRTKEREAAIKNRKEFLSSVRNPLNQTVS